ncbi:hypothetical protein MKX03_004166 [Papaver bracteatum]|nr:hypothetical protein MKX03_004166 [Papaver bracteatum]
MKGSKDLALTFADKCKNIMASNWRGYLNTVKADAKGSKEDIHTSRIMYFIKSGKPYLCVPQEDLHNLNVVIDERGSMAVANPYLGPLANVLKSIGKLPTRVALTSDVMSLEKDKVTSLALEFLQLLSLHPLMRYFQSQSLIIPMLLTVKYFHCSSYPHTSLLGFTFLLPYDYFVDWGSLDLVKPQSINHCHVMCLLSYLCLLLSYMEYIYIYIKLPFTGAGLLEDSLQALRDFNVHCPYVYLLVVCRFLFLKLQMDLFLRVMP